jgi:phage terminase large subunit-like protein
MKSGAVRNGHWYASQYPTGWYIVSADHENMGPFKSFEEGRKAWEKKGIH